ncbi:MAG: hypothetical protein IJP66_03100, partial [Kiritimatiellae bacterium]|nr:hypothetical protein [Kiritimatiellia bacterium]
PQGTAAKVDVAISTDPFDELPEPAPDGIASFAFMASRDGSPVPCGWTAEGWLPLCGAPVPDAGTTTTLSITVDSGRVSYALDGATLSDATGRHNFPAAGSPRRATEFSLVGTAPPCDFTATLREPRLNTRLLLR